MIRRPSFGEALGIRLDAIREQGLYRELRRVDSPQSVRIQIDGQSLLNFSSNDYLGLANDPRLTEAAVHAVQQFGAGAGASRLICGSLAAHHELEDALAAFKGTAAALTFSSGYAAALGAIGALLDREDVIVIDKRVHACLVDAAKLSGAKLRVFAHNDLSDLERILKWADQRISGTPTTRRAQSLIVTESVFSMDGDHAPLDRLVDLKDRYGAWLMLDEAHATGLYGPRRRGLADAFGVNDRIEIQMGTLGKALGSAGGCVCGSRALIDLLVNRARSFIFSTAPPPASAAAARAALEIVQSQDGEARCKRLWQRAAQVVAARNPQTPQGGATGPSHEVEGSISTNPVRPHAASAILPILIGDEARAIEAAQALNAAGIFIPAIRHPSVPRGQARLRLTVTANHTTEDVTHLLAALSDLNLPF